MAGFGHGRMCDVCNKYLVQSYSVNRSGFDAVFVRVIGRPVFYPTLAAISFDIYMVSNISIRRNNIYGLAVSETICICDFDNLHNVFIVFAAYRRIRHTEFDWINET